MRYRLSLILGAAVFFPAESPFAQNAAQHNARIVGIVIDSLHNSGLEGAEVIVSGLSTPAITDSLGRFTVDSLAPGTYQIGVFHPLLETLGLTLASKPFTVGRDSTGVADLAIPSAETLARHYCKSAVTAAQPAVVAGRVLDPDTDQPIPGATISFAWLEVTVSKDRGIVRTQHDRRTESDSTGFFRICGLPEGLDATVQASRSGLATGEVSINTHGSPLTFENLALGSVNAGPKGTVRGSVRSLDDKPVAGARVEAPAWETAVITKDDGSFNLAGIPTGTQLIVVRRLGYEPTRVAVNVTSRQPIDVRVTLGPMLNLLDPVLVTARRNYALEKDGFIARQRSGWGKYFTRADIERRNPQYLSDMLTALPGIRVDHRPGGASIREQSVTSILGAGRPGGNCPTVWVDGKQWRTIEPGDIDQFVSPREIAGLEVYKSSEVPPQFRGINDCITIVVWTQSPFMLTQR